MRIAFTETALPTQGALAVGVLNGRVLTASAEKIDKKTGGALRRAMKSGRFKGAEGQAFELIAPGGTRLDRVIVYGLGKAAQLKDLKFEALGGRMVKRFNGAGVANAAIAVDPIRGSKLKTSEMAARVAMGARLASYRFDRYRTKEAADKKPTLKTLTVTSRTAAAARKAFEPMAKVAEGVILTRDLVSEPANVINPKTLARQARELGKLGVKVEVLGRARMAALGMGALLGVAQGSANEPQFVVMQWRGTRKKGPPIAFRRQGRDV